MYHTFKDHQGSLAAVVHGNTVERLSHDPWGRRRNPAGFGYDNVSHTFDRGFTGHEHLSAFGLVNMDGRVYDPVMSCFLSPDLYVPGTADPRSYNRFAYCMHNPLRYVDPSGWRPRQPAPGSTPSSGDFIREIYAYSERAYEPRDFGIHPSLMSDIDVVWMEENQLHGGGGSGAVFSDLIELLSSPIYDEKGVLLGITKEGFTGQVLIYIGSDNIDFSSLSETDALLIEGVFTFDKLTDVLSGEAKSNIWTNIVSQMEGIEVYDEVFHMSDLNENQVLFNSSINSSWLSSYTLGTGKGTIQGSDKYVYETTVENILSSIVIHEYYSHIKKNNGDNFKSHRLAYKNVINYKPLWNLTTDAYKGFVVRQLNIYTRNETGRIKVDPPYRYSYYKYKDYH